MNMLEIQSPVAVGFPSSPVQDLDADLTERIERRSVVISEHSSPFEARFRVEFELDSLEAHHSIPVPPGRQLVIECVRARVQGGPAFWPRGQVLLIVQTHAVSRDAMHCFRFAAPDVDASRLDPNVFWKTRLLADPGSRIELDFIREAEEDARGVVVSVFGTLQSPADKIEP